MRKNKSFPIKRNHFALNEIEKASNGKTEKKEMWSKLLPVPRIK